METSGSMPALPPVGDLAGQARLARAGSAARSGDVSGAARQFERLFATLLVKEMRSTLPEGFFGKGAGSDVFDGWLDEHLGASLADGRGLGLRLSLERSLGEKQAQQESAGQEPR